MNLLQNLQWRYATKRMTGEKVPAEKVDAILEAIRLSPTSMGLQAFKVFVIEDVNLRKKIFEEACQQPQITESSEILVFAAAKKVTQTMVDQYIQSIASTRGMSLADLDGFKAMFKGFIDADEQQNFVWTARQTYIALGVATVAAAEQQVDATPMEGFNPVAMDEILGLSSQNLSSTLILALGYRNPTNDYLVHAAKVRKPIDELIVKK